MAQFRIRLLWHEPQDYVVPEMVGDGEWWDKPVETMTVTAQVFDLDIDDEQYTDLDVEDWQLDEHWTDIDSLTIPIDDKHPYTERFPFEAAEKKLCATIAWDYDESMWVWWDEEYDRSAGSGIVVDMETRPEPIEVGR